MIRAVRISVRYFAPKRFEVVGQTSVYEYLGIRFFKRHLLWTEKLCPKPAFSIGETGRWHALRQVEWETRRNESIHLLFLVLIGVVMVANMPTLTKGEIIAIVAINFVVNLYPIFLQRYNRYRLFKLFARCGLPPPHGVFRPAPT